MDSNKPSPFAPYLFTGAGMAAAGWGGLFLLVSLSLPFLGFRWLFFVLLTLALAGTALPVAYFLNLRFPSKPPAGPNVIVRQALWLGVLGDLMAWFQLGRLLTPILAFFIAAGLILIEVLLRFNERSHFKPQSDGDE
ncbi:hypothetical protein LARV_01903 [Longilinea arvoryzae]|uniref:Uncharacterized protein n=1 Tax=Longilinea arvoryzae TaxID=360412 RepID=A0A0S7BJL9_9CHLR|nr:hypothetical protein [Longilinea arvoryzae]GAP14139.1 hypothetical protein LARV_01903 [Longilinea arvoryzae]